MMKDLLLYIAKNLVAQPDAVSVTEVERETTLVFELRVAQEDMGKVIGRGGRIAKDIRTVMKTAAMKENRQIQVEIVESRAEA